MAAAKKTKAIKIDFYVVTYKNDRKHGVVKDLLDDDRGFTDALGLTPGEPEQHQIRSIVVSGGKSKVYRGVFGRVRFGEKPVQGNEDGEEADVDLKPGHGLVEKNYFIFYSDRNLLVYQRNTSGSHYSKLQHYINQVTKKSVQFEPILTTDAYERLLADDVNARSVELSFQKPKDPSLYPDAWSKDAIDLINSVGGLSARIKVSVGRSDASLLSKVKNSAVKLARGGLASVARVKVAELDSPIDLILDRVIATANVEVDQNGRLDPGSLYAELNAAVEDKKDDLQSFFGK
jgi:hypothetical protein